MRRVLAGLLFISLVAPSLPDEVKPAALTPQETKDGWLLLFDGETTFGWKTLQGPLQVQGGELILGGVGEASMTPTTEFTSFELLMEYRVEGAFPVARLVVDSRHPSHGSVTTASVTGTAGSVLKLAMIEDKTKSASLGLSSEAKVDVGSEKKSEVSFKAVHHATQGNYRPIFRFETPSGTQLCIRSIKLRPLDLQPIFNGKDLTGWKEFPGRKSKFTVTDQGELNVQNGPGDLQTEGQWANFVLQLNCISHGPHLNSGIFFRCIPDQYQQGYEAQIRNEWKDNDRTKPVDFGTGAIYRRQPARKVVSSDDEWFTMTVVAHGNHLATWVNGYPVADWTDERPPHRNPREGCCTEKGGISIQGHDPTTNLSFRNIRIGELP